jgi:hypothetical protein
MAEMRELINSPNALPRMKTLSENTVDTLRCFCRISLPGRLAEFA